MKNKKVKYILIGVLGCVGFVVAWAFIDTLIHPDRTFERGLTSIFDWFLGVVFGSSCAFSLWKKDNQGGKKE